MKMMIIKAKLSSKTAIITLAHERLDIDQLLFYVPGTNQLCLFAAIRRFFLQFKER